MTVEEIASIAPAVTVGLVIGVGLVCIPAIQARRRGYSFFIWLAAGILASNPIFLLVVLGVCPHRKRQALREQFRRDLDAKLGDADLPVVRAINPVRDVSIGDLVTADPQTTAGRPVRDVSLGDVPTFLPDARSIGDEPTRMP